MITRGAVHWVDFGEAQGSGPAKRRPVVVVQNDVYNASRLGTTVVVTMTSNLGLATMPGNVFVPARACGLPKDSVVNVTSVAAIDNRDLGERVGALDRDLLDEIETGLRSVLGL